MEGTQQGGGLELEEDEELNTILNHLTLSIKLISDWMVTRTTAKGVIQRAWNPKSGVVISNMDEHVFLFTFKSMNDIKRVWNRVIISYYGRGILRHRLEIWTNCFEVRYFGIPLNMCTKTNCTSISRLLGTFIEADLRQEGGIYQGEYFWFFKP